MAGELFLRQGRHGRKQPSIGQDNRVEHFTAGETAPASEMVLAGLIAEIGKSFGTQQPAAPWTSGRRLPSAREGDLRLSASAFQTNPTIGQDGKRVKREKRVAEHSTANRRRHVSIDPDRRPGLFSLCGGASLR